MGDPRDQRDYEPVRDRLDVFLQFPQLCRVWQTKGWERERAATDSGNHAAEIPDGFVEITEQIEMPF